MSLFSEVNLFCLDDFKNPAQSVWSLQKLEVPHLFFFWQGAGHSWQCSGDHVLLEIKAGSPTAKHAFNIQPIELSLQPGLEYFRADIDNLFFMWVPHLVMLTVYYW